MMSSQRQPDIPNQSRRRSAAATIAPSMLDAGIAAMNIATAFARSACRNQYVR